MRGAHSKDGKFTPQLISLGWRKEAKGNAWTMEVVMKLSEKKLNNWLSKIENAWFYLRNPSLFLMNYERVKVRVQSSEDLYDYDLEA